MRNSIVSEVGVARVSSYHPSTWLGLGARVTHATHVVHHSRVEKPGTSPLARPLGRSEVTEPAKGGNRCRRPYEVIEGLRGKLARDVGQGRDSVARHRPVMAALGYAGHCPECVFTRSCQEHDPACELATNVSACLQCVNGDCGGAACFHGRSDRPSCENRAPRAGRGRSPSGREAINPSWLPLSRPRLPPAIRVVSGPHEIRQRWDARRLGLGTFDRAAMAAGAISSL